MRKILLTLAALLMGSFAVVAQDAPAGAAAVVAPVAAPAAPHMDIAALKAMHHKHKGHHGAHHHHKAGAVGAGTMHPVHGNVYNSAHKNKHECHAHCMHHHAHVMNVDPAFHAELLKECRMECNEHHKTAQVTNPNGPGKGAGAKPQVQRSVH